MSSKDVICFEKDVDIGNYCGPNVFEIRLRTMTENTWKILKLDWKTPGIFFFQKSGNPVNVVDDAIDSSEKDWKSVSVHMFFCRKFNC